MPNFSRFKFISYPLLFIVVTLFFIYLTLPVHVLKDYLADKIVTALFAPKRPVEVKIAQLTPWRLSGIQARGLKISAKINGKAVIWDLKSAAVRTWISGLLFGNRGFSFRLNAGSGEAFGQVSFASNDRWNNFALSLDDLSLSKTPLELLIGVPVNGAINMTLNISGGDNLAKKGAGTVSLKANKLVVGPGAVEGLFGFGGAFALPEISLGRVEIEIKLADGRGQSKKVVMTGGDLELSMTLETTLNDSIMASRINGGGWFKISDNLRANNPEISSLLELFLGKQAMGGKNAFKFNGTLGSPGAYLDRNAIPGD